MPCCQQRERSLLSVTEEQLESNLMSVTEEQLEKQPDVSNRGTA